MNNSNYFYKIKQSISNNFLESLNDVISKSLEDKWQKKYDFERLTLSTDLFKEEEILYDLIKKFNCEKRLSIFRWKENTAYNWHTDPMRNASVNLLLSGWDSLCLFGKLNLENQDDQNIKNLEVLNYTTNECFVLNTTEHHSVINFNNPRYLMSICIPHPYTFEDVVNYLESK
jgi:hypothetical protein